MPLQVGLEHLELGLTPGTRRSTHMGLCMCVTIAEIFYRDESRNAVDDVTANRGRDQEF